MILPRGPIASMRSPVRAAEIQSVPGPAPCRETSIDTVRSAGSKLPDGVAAVHHPVAGQRNPQHQVLTRRVPQPLDPRRRQHHPTERRSQRARLGHLEVPQCGVSQRPAGRPTMSSIRSVPCPGGLPGITCAPSVSPARRVTHDHPHAGEVLETGVRAGRRPLPLGPRHAPRESRSRTGEGVPALHADPRGRVDALRLGEAAGSVEVPRTATMTPVPGGTSAAARKVSSRPTWRRRSLAAVHRERDHGLNAPACRRVGGHDDLPVDHLVVVLAGGATPSSTHRLTSRSAWCSTPR